MNKPFAKNILMCGMALLAFPNGSWAHEGTVPGGASIVVRTNETINVEEAGSGSVYTAFIDRDITDRSGRLLVGKGEPAELVVRRLPDGALGVDLQAVRGEPALPYFRDRDRSRRSEGRRWQE